MTELTAVPAVAWLAVGIVLTLVIQRLARTASRVARRWKT